MGDRDPYPLPPKKDVAQTLLGQGHLFVHIDPRRSEVVVPKWLTKQPQLILQVGLDAPTVDDDGIRATLTFRRVPFACTLPWSAVYALIGEHGRGMIWPDDVPVEVTPTAAKRRPARSTAKRTRAKLPPRSVPPAAPIAASPLSAPLRAIQGGARPLPDPDFAGLPRATPSRPAVPHPVVPATVGRAKGTRRPLPPYLRVIK